MDPRLQALGVTTQSPPTANASADMSNLGIVSTSHSASPTGNSQSPAQGGDLLSELAKYTNWIPGATLGEDIGTLGGFGLTKLKDVVTGGNTSGHYDLSAPTPLQATGDAASMLLTGATGGVPGGVANLVPGLAGAAPLGSSLFKTANGASKLAAFGNALGRIGMQAGIGAGYGLSNGLASGKYESGTPLAPTINASGLTKNTEKGALFSGGLAGAVELGAALLSSVANTTSESRLMDQVQKSGSAKTLTRAFNDASTGTTNPVRTMEDNGLTKDLRVLDSKINIDGITNPNGTGSLDNLIQDQQDMGTQAVKIMKGGVPLEDFKTAVVNSIKSNPVLKASGNISKMTGEAERMFNDYAESYGETIPYEDVNSIRVAMNKKYDPETWDVQKSVGNAARSILYNGTGAGTTLKSAMQNEQELINAKQFVNKLMGTSVKGGQLTKIIASLGGSIAGAATAGSIPVVGPAIGATVGGMAANKGMSMYQNNYFDPVLGGAARSLGAFAASPAAKSAAGYSKGLILAPATK